MKTTSLLSFAALCTAGNSWGQFSSNNIQGPSSSQTPYYLSYSPEWKVTSLLSVGDSIGGYEMVGIPDGLGAYNNPDGTSFTILMHHETGPTAGVKRAHGSKGSFISKWTVEKASLRVTKGEDLIKTVQVYNTVTGTYGTGATDVEGTGAALNRLCSADLPAVTALFNSKTNLGTKERVMFSGEETSPPSTAYHGRLFATPATGPDAGIAFELPRLGNLPWENAVPSPFEQDATIVMCMDDGNADSTSTVNPCELYVYVGTKTATGNTIEKAGLTNGSLHGLQIAGTTSESVEFGLGNTSFVGEAAFTLFNLGDVSSDADGVKQQADSIANGLFRFRRTEDGAWDPVNPNRYYFVTTDNFDQVADGSGTRLGRTRLWQLDFSDIKNPTVGGRIKILYSGPVDASDANGVQEFGPQMMDNMTASQTPDGVVHLKLQEDPGGNAHSAKIWDYVPATGKMTLIAGSDPQRFGNRLESKPFNGGAGGTFTNNAALPPFNNDEESSGIIPLDDIMGPGWFLFDVQAHYPIVTPTSLVQGGQLAFLHKEPLSDLPDAGNGYKKSFLGKIFDAEYPFIYSPVHSWMYLDGNSEKALNIWNGHDLGWVYTSSDLWPRMYSYKRKSFLRYISGKFGKRTFYHGKLRREVIIK